MFIQQLHELALVRLVGKVPTIVEAEVLRIHAQGGGNLGHTALATVDFPQLPWLTKVHVAQGLGSKATPKSAPAGNAAKRQAVESMAFQLEGGMVMFEDSTGAERTDCAMMDPGASSFLL